MLDIAFGQASNPGRLRRHNSDSAAAFIPRSAGEAQSLGWLFAIADGQGNKGAAELASARAVHTLLEGFGQARETESLPQLVPRLLQKANEILHHAALSPEADAAPLSATVVACAIRGCTAVIAHLGDSRCYHIRHGRTQLLTEDHTWVAEQQKLGLMTTAQAEESEMRHRLTRCLGPEPSVDIPCATLRLEPRDVLVLCTNGLYDAMYTDDIARISTQNPKSPDLIAQELVRYAVEVDGSDNATAQIIRIEASPAASHSLEAPSLTTTAAAEPPAPETSSLSSSNSMQSRRIAR